MDGSDLSFLGLDVSLDQVKPLGTKRIVTFVNSFLIKNVQMLNRFVYDMEKRIIDMDNRISRIEVELKLLESKLDSIPGLKVAVSTVSKSSKQLSEEQAHDINSEANIVEQATNENAIIVNRNSWSAGDSVGDARLVEESASKNTNSKEPLRIIDDPRYAVYFRMLKMGVPESAVKQKMISEGVSAALLDTPYGPSDLRGGVPATVDDKGSTSGDDDLDSVSSYNEV